MAATYKKQDKAVLISLCEQRGLDGTDKTKEMLIRALVEDDAKHQRHVVPEPGTYTAHGDQAMDMAPELADPEGASSSSSRSGVDSCLPLILQQMSECDPQMRMQLILQERQAEREFAERQAEREAAERQAERQAEREYQLELARLQLHTFTPQNRESRDTITTFKPRLEHFPVMEKDGDLDTFLRGFEKACRQYQLPSEQWARYLTPGLKGKALEVFAALPLDQDGDYDAIKQALIRKYNLTPEVYRKRFRTLQRGPNDSYSDVVDGLRINLQQWIRGFSITTFEGLEDLIIKDQLLHICPVEVRQFVLDREPKDAAQAAHIADAYLANREPAVRKPSIANWKGGKPTTNTFSFANRPSGGPGPVPPTRPAFDSRRCFVCNKLGHLSTTCPEKKKNAPLPKPPGSSPAVLCVGGIQGKPSDNLQSVTVGNTVTVGLRDTGAEMTLVRPELVSMEDIIPGKTLTVTGIGGVHPALPMARVYLDWGTGRGLKEVGVSENIPTNVLLGTDLGRLVSQYVASDVADDPASSVEMCDVDDKVICSPLDLSEPCHVELSNDVNVLCDHVEPCNAILLGDATKVIGNSHITSDALEICPDNGNMVYTQIDPQTLVSQKRTYISAVTRSQNSHNLDICLPANSPESATEEPSEAVAFTSLLATQSQEFQAALHDDASLDKLRDLAGKTPDESDKERIFWDQGRLYRETIPCDHQQAWLTEQQLIVPHQFREQLMRVAHEIPLAGHLGVQKTKARLAHNFYWPKMGTDIANYCGGA
ncbi:uncharacterized protein LOC142652014 [Rhinoderma darwinii]|uniref:uncharacterized protein LOC142652014 n=1 Tax=Rhinoderma darwinii TaxID=43563 RepID=UPI003F66B534